MRPNLTKKNQEKIQYWKPFYASRKFSPDHSLSKLSISCTICSELKKNTFGYDWLVVNNKSKEPIKFHFRTKLKFCCDKINFFINHQSKKNWLQPVLHFWNQFGKIAFNEKQTRIHVTALVYIIFPPCIVGFSLIHLVRHSTSQRREDNYSITFWTCVLSGWRQHNECENGTKT